MSHKDQPITQLKVAIIGAGPAGLGAAIEFAKISFVKWNLYEQATSIREIGAGISIQRNTWRLLDVMGASRNFKPGDFYRPGDNYSVQHRNGRTGELLDSHAQHDTPENHLHARTHRAKLQNALLKEVDHTRIRLSSRLTKVERQASGKLSLEFQDGFKDVVDLLVGADGVRSVVRNFAFPDHRISYTGRTAYRTIVSTEEISTIPEVPDAVTFWHGPNSWLYTCSLGDNKFEITTMTREPEEKAKKVSWGQDATKEEMIRHFKEFAPVAQKVLALPNEVKQYALFAGPRLESVVAHGSVALVGDASHPLSGAFGAGAGFALEDVYVLTQSISWAHQRKLTLQEGLNLFDKIRGPHYKRLYSILDEYAVTVKYLEDAQLGFDESVKMIVERNWNSRYKWLVDYDVQQVVRDTIEQGDSLRSVARENPRL